MKKNSELEVGDIIEVPVPHTAHVTKHVITRVTATQYITSTRKFNKQLKVLGTNGKYPVYGQQPKAIEPIAEPIVAAVTVVATAETVVHTVSKIETTESQPVIQEIPESKEVVEIADKPIERLPEYVQVCGRSVRNHDAEKHVVLDFDNTPRKVELAPFNALISIENAQKIVRLAKCESINIPVYAVAESIDESERNDGKSHNVLYVTSDSVLAKKIAWGDKTELSEACRLIEIREDETFFFEELDCEAVTYAATVDAQWIMHPNGQWKIYFHDTRPEDAVNDCRPFEFNGFDLNGDEYLIEIGFNDFSEQPIVFRVYAKDIEWDGKTRDLVCICRHPDALPEDDLGYKRPVASKPAIAIPWLKTESKEYEYGY
jgi:hypothetical protein